MTKEEIKARAEEKEIEAEIAKEEKEKKDKEAKIIPVKKEAEKFYTVCVTGFYRLGKMFRANDPPISASIYKDYVKEWLEKGYIR